MLTKTRHNKKRNTAFLYEALVRELTKSIVSKDSERKKAIICIMKEHFAAGTILRKELDLFKDLYENTSMHPYTCEKLIQEVKRTHSTLDKDKVFEEQTSLINKINKMLSRNVYTNFVPNYKNLATIAQILNPDVSAKSRVLLESNLVKVLSSEIDPSNKEMVPIDNLVYSTFVKKFNEQYGDDLLEEQKELLSRYIASFHDNAIELSIFLNEEISNLTKSLGNANKKAVESDNTSLQKNITKVLAVLRESAISDITIDTISQVLKIQSLVKELESHGN
jgi:protein required for attachment to host cells